MAKQRVLSGMRPTGRLHLGNYLGALDNWVKLQDEYECFFFIADWHALTTDYADTSSIRPHTREVAIDMLAAGIDPQRSTLFVQSSVPEHAELHLLFSMFIPVPWLERVPTYKEKQQEETSKDLSTYGFLGYPVLMAADILIYRAQVVPVGVDQVAHLELTREIARRFNTTYATVFPEPQPKLTEVPKLLGTDGYKMSKSRGNTIELADPAEAIAAKVRPMVTDPARKRRTDPGNPDICPVFDYHKVFSPLAVQAEAAQGCRTAGIGCLDCKGMLLKHMIPALSPIQERRTDLARHPERVQEVLHEGAKRAQREAAKTMADVREAMRIN
jgi:tryptophanyl-tRNA synthetase